MRAIRAWLAIFIIGLVLSGATAFPLVGEVRLLTFVLHHVSAPGALVLFLDRVREGLLTTGTNYPFIAYGTDWLAFAHWWWLPIDISFGVVGIIPLIIVHRLIKRLDSASTAHSSIADRHTVDDHA
jgi:hypothetical protein